MFSSREGGMIREKVPYLLILGRNKEHSNPLNPLAGSITKGFSQAGGGR